MKAVIYARYSSHSQTEQSIEGQLRDGYAWAEQNNVTIINEYIDRALTGTKDARPAFQRMISDAEKRQFDLVIVWKLDRFARNRYDSAIYKARLKKYGVRVVSVKENITDKPEGIILEGLLESMAEYYSANLSENVRRGMRETVEKGRFCGGIVPYGYKSENGRLVPDEHTAPIIRYVFEEYARGTAKKEIIDELNRRGVRNRNGKPLTYTSFQHALRMTTYIGEHVYDGKIVHGCADPLVSREVFDKVQARLDRVAHAPAAAKARVPYLLQGKIHCGLCGSPMFGESGKSHTGAFYAYYSCYTRKRRHDCHKSNERRETIESLIITRTMDYILAPSNMAAIARAVVAEYNSEFSDTRVTDLEKARARLDRDLEQLVDALIDVPKSARQAIYDRMEQIESRKAELDTDIAKLRVAAGIRLTEREVIAWLSTFRDGDPSDPAFRSRLVDAFINAVYVYEDRIIVFYNTRGGKQITPKSILSAMQKDSKPESSDLESSGGPGNFKSEPQYIFVNGVFGCIFRRYENAQ